MIHRFSNISLETSHKSLKLLVGIITFLIPFIANYNFIIRHFYLDGAYIFDSAFFASLMWHNSIELPNPLVINNYSYFLSHIVPLFWLTSIISHILPLDMVNFFAVFQGLVYGLLALSIYYFAVSQYPIKNFFEIIFAGFIGVCFAFNDLVRSTIFYPHHEIFAVATILFFLVFWLQHKYRIASVFFTLALLTREDIGFHIVAILTLNLGLNWLINRRQVSQDIDQKITIKYILAAFIYSFICIVIQKTFFSSYSLFTTIYTGNPPYGHLTLESLKERFIFYRDQRFDLYIPFLLTLGFSCLSKNWYLILGYFAYLPWFLLNFTAYSNAANQLQFYYAYPFIISLGWVFLATSLKKKNSTESSQNKSPRFTFMFVFLFIILSSSFSSLIRYIFTEFNLKKETQFQTVLTGMNQDLIKEFNKFSFLPKSININNIQSLVRMINRNSDVFGRWVCDSGIASLTPRTVLSEQVFSPKTFNYWSIDTIIFFKKGYESPQIQKVIDPVNFPYYYQVKNSEIFVVSKKNLLLNLSLQPLLKPKTIFEEMSISPSLKKIDEGWFVSNKTPAGFVVFGPYISLPPNKYDVKFVVKIDQVIDPNKPIFELDVVDQKGTRIIIPATAIKMTDLKSSPQGDTATVSFTIPPSMAVNDIEFRLNNTGNGSFSIIDVELNP